jgi:hypothetical protein
MIMWACEFCPVVRLVADPGAAPSTSAAACCLGLVFDSRRGLGCLSLVNVVCYADRGFCDRPTPGPGASYRLCM